MTKIWRVYNNGSIKNETHILWPHCEGTGYNGDVDAWSAHNQRERFGCAQIVQHEGEEPTCIYAGYLDEEQITTAINQIKDQQHG